MEEEMSDENEEHDSTDGSEDYDYDCRSCLGTGIGRTPDFSCTSCGGKGYHEPYEY